MKTRPELAEHLNNLFQDYITELIEEPIVDLGENTHTVLSISNPQAATLHALNLNLTKKENISDYSVEYVIEFNLDAANELLGPNGKKIISSIINQTKLTAYSYIKNSNLTTNTTDGPYFYGMEKQYCRFGIKQLYPEKLFIRLTYVNK